MKKVTREIFDLYYSFLDSAQQVLSWSSPEKKMPRKKKKKERKKEREAFSEYF